MSEGPRSVERTLRLVHSVRIDDRDLERQAPARAAQRARTHFGDAPIRRLARSLERIRLRGLLD
jgi:hypothetical protein